MPRSLISLGANLGNVVETMRAAGRLLREEFSDARVSFSRLYRTPPVGGPSGQSDFLNAVGVIESKRSCWEIWESIKRVETELGRQRQHRWEARRIDIDLLLHHSERVWTPHLKVPHPRMCMRSFVLVPATEIAADMVDPVTGWTLLQLRKHIESPAPRPLSIVCNTQPLQQRIAMALGTAAADHPLLADRILHCAAPRALIDSLTGADATLSVVCVETPDPETIQWEDYSAPWAAAMGLSSSERTPLGGPSYSTLLGPRYLLPANDVPWALHELSAAAHAMGCPIHPTHHEILNDDELR